VGLTIRVVVAGGLPKEQQNAMLHLFSARKELIEYGQKSYHPYAKETSTLIYKLLKAYSEDPTMSETLKQFFRESVDDLLKELPPEELRKALPVEERLKGLPAEERLKGLSGDQLIEALSPEQREALVRHFKTNGSSPKSE
jgi:hypothetical protein